MDWRNAEQTMEESKGGGALDKKHFLISKQAVNNNMAGKNPTNAVESSTALQRFLDRIPIGAIPGINNSSAAGISIPCRQSCAYKVFPMFRDRNKLLPVRNILLGQNLKSFFFPFFFSKLCFYFYFVSILLT